jgi:hypothetical protein
MRYGRSQVALIDNRFAENNDELPFEDFDRSAGARPVKVFVITDDMRRRDEVDRRKRDLDREARITWRLP